MSLQIDDVDDLHRFLRKQGVKLTSADEVRDLFQTIRAGYNPDQARLKAIKHLAITTVAVAVPVAGAVSVVALGTSAGVARSLSGVPAGIVGFLIVLWLAVAAVCVVANVCCARFLARSRPGDVPAGAPARQSPERAGFPAATAIKEADTLVTRHSYEVP